jgi:hypothetical protein
MLKLSQLRRLKALDSFTASDIVDALQLPVQGHTAEWIIRDDNHLHDLLGEVLTRFHNDNDTDNPYVYCTDCGVWEPREDGAVIDDGNHKCEECINENYFRSDYSDEYFYCDERCTVNTNNGAESWSQYEVDRYAWACDDCEEYFSGDCHRNDTDTDAVICHGCYENNWSTCGHCDTVTRSDNEDGDGDAICGNCISNFTYCENHEEWHRNDDDCWEDEDDDGEHYCLAPNSCFRSGSSSPVIRSYTARVEDNKAWGTPMFRGRYLRRKLPALYMGIELEVEARNYEPRQGLAKMILEATDEVFCCEDGSLTHGFEIKTPPNNLEETKAIFEAILASDAPAGLRSHNGGNCGLHINLSRNGLSQLQQAKIMFFFNSSKNALFLKQICRRFSVDSNDGNHTNYARACGDPKLSHIVKAWRRDTDADERRPHTAYCNHRKRGKVWSKSGNVFDYRYAAVNFTDKKVEIRLPRGTLKRNTLMANLELAAALVEFTRTGENYAQTGRYVTEFMHYLKLRPRSYKDFPELVKWCVDRDWLPVTMIPVGKPQRIADLQALEAVLPTIVVESISEEESLCA